MVNSGRRQTVAVFVFGQKNTAAQILARHIQKWISRLNQRNFDKFGFTRIEGRAKRTENTGRV